MIKNFLLVALGGALGSMLRYGISLLGSCMALSGEWTTLTVNLIGSFLIGLAMPGSDNPYLLLYTVGFCGGFTTYSTFSLQALKLFSTGQYAMGLLYIIATTVFSLAMVALGCYCRQKIWG